MGNYKILDHTADLKMEFSGENFEDFLNSCAEGLSNYLYERKGEKNSFTYKRTFDGTDKTEFIVSFLNELLYLMQQKRFIPSNILLKEEKGKYVVYFKGEKASLKPLSEIKAATFHNLKIEEERNILKAEVTFDL
ncbi:MAG: archease [Thermoanaerobaculia bacterium]